MKHKYVFNFDSYRFCVIEKNSNASMDNSFITKITTAQFFKQLNNVKVLITCQLVNYLIHKYMYISKYIYAFGNGHKYFK